jgi:hypothetical protein
MKINKTYKVFVFIGIITAILLGIIIFKYINSYTLPKIAWLYWESEEKPDLIQNIEIYNSSKLEGWKINYLNKDSVYNFIKKEEFPNNYDSLYVAHKADWIRLKLLSKYGGCWIDASIIINDKLALDKLYDESIKKRSQLTVFSWKNKDSDNKLKPSLYIENWFIMAPKNSSIVYYWLNEYEKAIRLTFRVYKPTLYKQGVNLSKIFDTTNDDDNYLMQHACLQKVLQKQFFIIPSIIIKEAEKDMFKLHTDCDWSTDCIMNSFNKEPHEIKQIPYIKLTGQQRTTNIDISKYFK